MLTNGAVVRWDGSVKGDELLQRGLDHHLRGVVEDDLEDLLRVFLAGVLLPAELALALDLPGVVIREDRGLGLFWFDNDDPDLTVTAQAATEVPLAVALRPPIYVVGIDDARGASEESATRAFELARGLGGTIVDRYGFLVTEVSQVTKR
ncbi:hypothetical protein [Actinomadura rudentiformis]|uniref:Uncharacterized protein n=1 Tax=Actinomadura rudentiformis TaxID=359158 RepID=A0A6H9Z2H0_9ACTN|nr:hypothetical protein [Actinomadura rudentiformis]KAB2348466.1 hypothetical protein F8566_16925 [Actinomadura rudentiformis]